MTVLPPRSRPVRPQDLTADFVAVKPSPVVSACTPHHNHQTDAPDHFSSEEINPSAVADPVLFRRPPSTPPRRVEYVEIPSKLAQEGEGVIVVEQGPEATLELIVELAVPKEQQGKHRSITPI
uniref:Uncharacterized protein n=1 Tax=Setaria viridis TaxID=4556 RepID=A0A4U6UH26_SETVI|nr:hypothetical protein SEVIR_5G154800v2 [Setaria viridis]